MGGVAVCSFQQKNGPATKQNNTRDEPTPAKSEYPTGRRSLCTARSTRRARLAWGGGRGVVGRVCGCVADAVGGWSGFGPARRGTRNTAAGWVRVGVGRRLGWGGVGDDNVCRWVLGVTCVCVVCDVILS